MFGYQLSNPEKTGYLVDIPSCGSTSPAVSPDIKDAKVFMTHEPGSRFGSPSDWLKLVNQDSLELHESNAWKFHLVGTTRKGNTSCEKQ